MKRQLHSINELVDFTPNEQLHQKWKIQKMAELGILGDFDDSENEDKSIEEHIRYMEIEAKAIEYLEHGVDVPEPLRNVLLARKETKSIPKRR